MERWLIALKRAAMEITRLQRSVEDAMIGAPGRYLGELGDVMKDLRAADSRIMHIHDDFDQLARQANRPEAPWVRGAEHGG